MFVLVENESCSSSGSKPSPQSVRTVPEDACSLAPKVNAPNFDSPCYNGGSCLSGSPANQARTSAVASYYSANYTCLCPPGFAGPLCEVNLDDCLEHQCQNGAMCVDGINSYKCVCRDPTTSGEFCEQLSGTAPSLSSFSSNSIPAGNSIAPIALPIVAASSIMAAQQQQVEQPAQQQQQILARSADINRQPVELGQASGCKRITKRKYYNDGNGCQSVRVLKISECAGNCGLSTPDSSSQGTCCQPAKVKRRRVRMQCTDGASYVKTIDLVKKCACASQCRGSDYANSTNQQRQQQQQLLDNQFNATQEDQLLQITRLDAVDWWTQLEEVQEYSSIRYPLYHFMKQRKPCDHQRNHIIKRFGITIKLLKLNNLGIVWICWSNNLLPTTLRSSTMVEFS